jgi:hypothetical protein
MSVLPDVCTPPRVTPTTSGGCAYQPEDPTRTLPSRTPWAILDYAEAFSRLDSPREARHRAVLTTQGLRFTDFGHYGPLMIRLADGA